MNTFLPQWIFTKIQLPSESICYAIRLSGAHTRKQNAPTGKLAGLVTGIGSAITDTISSAVTSSSYLLRMVGGEIYIVHEKAEPVFLFVQDIQSSIALAPGEIRAIATFPRGPIDNTTFKIAADRVYDTFCGNLKQFIADFDKQTILPLPNLFQKFVKVNISTYTPDPSSQYKFKSTKKFTTLISFSDTFISFHNENRVINFSNVLLHHSSKGYCAVLAKENNIFEFIEIFEDLSANDGEQEMNLIREVPAFADAQLQIPFPESLIHANDFLSAFEVNGLSLVAVDNDIYLVQSSTLSKCGIFINEGVIYVSTGENTFSFYGCISIINTLSLLPAGFDNIFLEKDVPQPFVCNGTIVNFIVSETGLTSEGISYEYDRMSDFSYNASNYNCRINFVYNSTPVEMITANSLGIFISNRQEKAYISFEAREFSINQLYDYYYRRFTKNFLAGTFAEIYKTEKLINNDTSVNELLSAMMSEDGEVLRGAFKSFIGKFKNIEDLQSTLVQKVALLELQRKKIQKLFDEWTLYYPHYMATMQVAWLKEIFGSNLVNKEMLNSEYWKSVACMKRTLANSNAYVQKSMNEIATCTTKISSALPSDILRADISQSLRVSTTNAEEMLKAGGNIMLGVSAGLEVTNIFLRGYGAANPLAISMSAKMLVDSYTKDVEMRKNVKAFGMQALEWWLVFMKGIQIHIMEATNSMNEFNKACLKRDTELFKKLPEEHRSVVMKKLSNKLQGKILNGVDDKFMEVMPQFNLRISNIIDEIDGNSNFCNMTLNEFENKLFV